MPLDAARLQELYLQMCRMRYVEQALGQLWHQGLISGELHSGAGEEAVVAGVVTQLREGDALSLDYRSTPPLVARGLDLQSLLLEVLGSPGGLCGGRGGHMHLMSKAHLAASSGIVGAPAPLACGFGLAARGTGSVAVAFFGDGAVNEGMVMEALNLAAAWRLPVVFVCKDNRWAVSTRSAALTGGGLRRRLAAFGMPVTRVDGTDVRKVVRAAEPAVARARAGGGPSVLLARVARMEGHFLGDPLVRLTQAVHELVAVARPLLGQATARPGAPLAERVQALLAISRRAATLVVERPGAQDPLQRVRLAPDLKSVIAARARQEVDAAVRMAVEAAHA